MPHTSPATVRASGDVDGSKFGASDFSARFGAKQCIRWLHMEHVTSQGNAATFHRRALKTLDTVGQRWTLLGATNDVTAS
jgi:hypothetical protein